MAAPKGNEFWKVRSKHGRDAIFTDPKILEDSIEEYFQKESGRVWNKNEAIKSGQLAGQIVEIPTSVPFTIGKLCLFLGVDIEYLTDFKNRVKDKDDENSKEFYRIITRAFEIIKAQKFDGATTGAFNPVIIARDLGLDRQAVEATGIGATINISIGGNKISSEDMI